MASLAISVVTFNTSEDVFAQTLSSISESVSTYKKVRGVKEVALRIVNNADEKLCSLYNPFLFETATEFFDDFRVIEGHGNIGYGSAHNLALAEMDAEFYLIMNPDVIIQRDAIRVGVDFLNTVDNVIALNPFCEDQYGNRQYLCKTYPSVLGLLLRAIPKKIREQFFAGLQSCYEMRDMSGESPTTGVPLLSGCFVLAKREHLKAVGGFNPDYFLYFEDFDLSLRLGRMGDLAYLPQMKIVHRGGNASKKGIWHISMFVRSSFRFFQNHGWRWY